jgi:hypothetical protein
MWCRAGLVRTNFWTKVTPPSSAWENPRANKSVRSWLTRSSETPVLTRPTSQKTAFFIVAAMKTLTAKYRKCLLQLKHKCISCSRLDLGLLERDANLLLPTAHSLAARCSENLDSSTGQMSVLYYLPLASIISLTKLASHSLYFL